jgi:hypothetical protein
MESAVAVVREGCGSVALLKPDGTVSQEVEDKSNRFVGFVFHQISH